MIIELYKIYESREDTYNIPTLLHMVKKNELIPVAAVKTLDSIHARAKPIWVKISIIRNEIVAHNSNKSNEAKVFKKANVTPDEMVLLAELTKEFLNEFTGVWKDSRHAFSLSSRRDTLNLLEELSRTDRT